MEWKIALNPRLKKDSGTTPNHVCAVIFTLYCLKLKYKTQMIKADCVGMKTLNITF